MKRLLHGSAATPLFLLLAGCVTLDPFVFGDKGPPTGQVCRVVTTWCPQVTRTPDPTHGGDLIPGLAGRLYLFGPNLDFPLAGDGSVVVDLYDDCQQPPAPVPLEEWQLDKNMLQQLLRRDAVGWGYTLFLPWGTYKPEIRRVRLKVRYDAPKGAPIYAEGTPVTLSDGRDTGIVQTAGRGKDSGIVQTGAHGKAAR